MTIENPEIIKYEGKQYRVVSKQYSQINASSACREQIQKGYAKDQVKQFPRFLPKRPGGDRTHWIIAVDVGAEPKKRNAPNFMIQSEAAQRIAIKEHLDNQEDQSVQDVKEVMKSAQEKADKRHTKLGKEAEVGDTVTWKSGGDKKVKTMTGIVTKVTVHPTKIKEFTIVSKSGNKTWKRFEHEVRKVS